MNDKSAISIRDAVPDDHAFVMNLMCEALTPFYGGDHERHAERIFNTHISGGSDRLGFFSLEQRMVIAECCGERAGMLHLVVKRQGTIKISPLIVATSFRGGLGVGIALLNHADAFARARGARQLYCTVAEANTQAVKFFVKNGYTLAGRSDSHYKLGVTEIMLYRRLGTSLEDVAFDAPHVSVLPFREHYADQVRALLLQHLPSTFQGIDDTWVSALFNGYERRDSADVNAKYKLIFVAVDRAERVRGVAAATPKKGSPIKLMPFLSTDLTSFVALLKDVPYYLRPYGRKLYVHLLPGAEETNVLLSQHWRLNAAMPGAYHVNTVTQQWSLDIGDQTMRCMRVKDRFLRHIEDGDKDLEVRVAYDSMQRIAVGEFLEFASRSRAVMVRVKAIRTYPSLDEMLENEDSRRIVPHLTQADLRQLLHEIYPPDKERLGVLVIEIVKV